MSKNSRYHDDVAAARSALDDAKRRCGFLRGRGALNKATRRYGEAEASLQIRQRAIQAVSEKLSSALDRFAEAILHTKKCELLLRDAEAKAKRADQVLQPRDRLFSLIKRQKGRCGICGDILPELAGEIHVDHIRPRSSGGTDDPSNLQATHPICNLRKGAKWPWPDKAEAGFMHMRAQFWEAHLILREILANALEDDESQNINVRRIITQSIQARIAELQNEDPGNPFLDKGQLEYCKQVLLKTNPHQRSRDDDDEPDYFTPEIREILAQRGIGFPADEEPLPYTPGYPNRDTPATYEEAKSERQR